MADEAKPKIVVERDGPVTRITLNRPHVKNAVDSEMWDSLREIFRSIGYDPDVRVVVLTGAAGEFCSGADVSQIGERDSGLHPVEAMRKVGDTCLALHQLGKPVIARVDGVAAGAGANMALGCDLVVASDRSRFAELFARRGLSVDFGGSWLLPRMIGLHRAKELVLLGDVIDASRAAELGLVNAVVPVDELDDVVDGWADRLAQGPPIALRSSKVLLNQSFERTLGEALVDEARAQALNIQSDDAAEAAAAWRDKREPNFEGR